MKNYIVLLIALILTDVVRAQDGEMQTLFGNGRLSGAYGAFDLKVSPVNDEINLLLGGQAAVIFNEHAYIGVAGYGLSTREKFNGIDARLPENDPNRDIRIDMSGFGYGGLLFGYTVSPNSLIHIDIPVLIGAGGVDLTDDNITISDNDFTLKPSIESSAFFVAEPGLNIEINMARFFKLGLGGGYRYIYGTDLQNLQDSDLSGWTANVSMKFGKFD
ncbi:hypothetical protein HZR84_06685 [Hyphobacterium sp. CCMP332]|nr:hypothetical protein HZR84_06685 [Hyphobacterium sp. CCMP332]